MEEILRRKIEETNQKISAYFKKQQKYAIQRQSNSGSIGRPEPVRLDFYNVQKDEVKDQVEAEYADNDRSRPLESQIYDHTA